MKSFHNPWPLGLRMKVFALANYNLGQVYLPLFLAYFLGLYRPDFVSNNVHFILFLLAGIGGYGLTVITKGWFFSTVGYFIILLTIAVLVSRDIADKNNVSFEVLISMSIGITFVVAILLFKRRWFTSWIPHVISIFPIPITLWLILPTVMPILGMAYQEPTAWSVIFGLFINSSFIVMNMRSCYLRQNVTLNDVADSNARNIKGYLQQLVGRFKFDIRPVEEDNKLLQQLSNILDKVIEIQRLAIQMQYGESIEYDSYSRTQMLIQATLVELPPVWRARAKTLLIRRSKKEKE